MDDPHTSIDIKIKWIIWKSFCASRFYVFTFLWLLHFRSCKEYSCLDCCSTFALAKGQYLSPVQTNATSCNDGLLEPACRLAYHGELAYACTDATTVLTNNLTVAIVNSNSHSHVHKRGNYADYSPCHTFFYLRYALGLHNANMDDLKRFQSDDDYHNYVRHNAKLASKKFFDKN